jgi:hypothetical protein
MPERVSASATAEAMRQERRGRTAKKPTEVLVVELSRPELYTAISVIEKHLLEVELGKYGMYPTQVRHLRKAVKKMMEAWKSMPALRKRAK